MIEEELSSFTTVVATQTFDERKQSKQYELKEDSLKKRYVFKLLTNLIGIPIGIVTQSIIPRGLGLVAYGNFNYLTNFFMQIFSFFDASVSNAFYTKLSQRQQETGIIRYFWSFVLLLSIILVIFVSTTFLFQQQTIIWPEQSSKYIWLALFWGLLSWYSQLIIKVVDAYGLTKGGEVVRIAQKVIGLILILLMFWFKRFTLVEFFIYHYIILGLLCIAWWYVLKLNKISLLPRSKLTRHEIRNYSAEFYKYSSPLISYGLVAMIVGVLDRYILQKFAGSVAQSYYGLSVQVGAICFLFTSALTPLIIREMSVANASKDIDRMRNLFQRYSPLMYSIAAFFAVFIIIHADKVAFLMGGEKFKDAYVAIAIMSLYPIHQTYGQLSGSFFLATEQTKLFRNIGVIMMIVGLPVVYFLVAPESKGGLNMGAIGLAIKMVLLQFIGVNIQIWYNAKFMRISFLKLFAHQIYFLLILMGYGLVVSFIVNSFITNLVFAFLVNGVFYSIVIIVTVLIFPSIVWLTKNDVQLIFSKIRISPK
jgi:O-antigen/teichoic acid export membrane protein